MPWCWCHAFTGEELNWGIFFFSPPSRLLYPRCPPWPPPHMSNEGGECGCVLLENWSQGMVNHSKRWVLKQKQYKCGAVAFLSASTHLGWKDWRLVVSLGGKGKLLEWHEICLQSEHTSNEEPRALHQVELMYRFEELIKNVLPLIQLNPV